jgi:Response regulators consisting of a CheY-like receiver domain and a winged-helix DNA-binding domain
MKILLAEDDICLGELIKILLENHQFYVDWVSDGETALHFLNHAEYDLLVLDWMMPVKDGLEVCKESRKNGYQGGIMMLTAKDTLTEVVTGLDAGADDYIIKPFETEELLARIRAVGRRREAKIKEDIVRMKNLELNRTTKSVERGGRIIQLSLREFQIFELLVQNHGRVLPRELIIDRIWGGNSDITSNNLDSHIRLLRKKLEQPGEEPLIKTIKGIGFKLEENDVI